MSTVSDTAATNDNSSPGTVQNILKQLKQSAPIYLVLIVLLAWVGYLNPRFVEPDGFLQFLKRSAPLIILTAGQVYVLISGGFDLSAGSLMSFVVISSALLIDNDPARMPFALAILFAVGIGTGFINGAVTSYLKVPSIIVTLGMLLVINGAGLYWSGGARAAILPIISAFLGAVIGRFFPTPTQLSLPRYPMRSSSLWSLAWRFLGCCTEPTLANSFSRLVTTRKAARLGVKVERVRIIAFILSGISAVIAGILLGGFGGVTVDAGEGFELQAISAAVIGGTQLLGGRGSMPGALAGALTLQVLFTLLNLLGLPKPIRDAVQGIIIIAAVAYSAYRNKR